MTFLAAMLLVTTAWAAPKTYELKSPDGRLKVEIKTGNGICYTLKHDSDLLLQDSYVGMYMTDGTAYGENDKVVATSKRSVNETIETVMYKKSEVKDVFNELTLIIKLTEIIRCILMMSL